MKKLSSLSQKSGFLSSEITKFKGVRLKSIQSNFDLMLPSEVQL